MNEGEAEGKEAALTQKRPLSHLACQGGGLCLTPDPYRDALDSEVTRAWQKCGRYPPSRGMILFGDQKLQGQK